MKTTLLLMALALLFGTGALNAQDTPYTFTLSDVTAGYDPAVGTATVTTSISIVEDDGNDGYPNETQGFQLGVSHDDEILTLDSAEASGDLAALDDGDGPAFFGSNLEPTGGPGLTVGVVYSLTSDFSLNFDEDKVVLDVTYNTVPEALIDDDIGLSTELTFSDELGDPVLPCTVVVSTQSVLAEKVDATVTLAPAVGVPFIRGDANDDGIANIADAIFILRAVLMSGPSITCVGAGDADADNDNDMLDALFVLDYRFKSGDAPVAPFPDCGIAEDEDCESFDVCD